MSTPEMSPPLPAWPYPRWIAHRGAGKEAPENTLAAFRLGAQLGWPGFECDVKLSADGQLFLLHDATLERTTTGRGTAGDQAWDALSRLDAGGWHSPLYAGEPLPTLEAIAAFCQAQGRALNLEIKPTPGTAAATGHAVALRAQALWAQAVQAGRSTWPLLSSFEPDALAAARQAAPALPRALLLHELWDGHRAAALRLDCCAVVLHHALIDADTVAHFHAVGLQVACYTVNDAERADALLALGVVSVISDAVRTLGPARA
jgi:glycerophosphoryl diester phosphodiesterase